MHKVKRTQLYLTLLLVAILEVTALNRMMLFGVYPDFLLIVVLFFSLFSDRQMAAEAGIFAGLLRDLLTTGFFGINMLLFGALAVLVSISREKIYKEFFLTQMLLVVVASAFLHLGHTGFRFVSGAGFHEFGRSLITVFMPAVLYTSLISPLVFFILRRTSQA